MSNITAELYFKCFSQFDSFITPCESLSGLGGTAQEKVISQAVRTQLGRRVRSTNVVAEVQTCGNERCIGELASGEMIWCNEPGYHQLYICHINC